ncbi:MAG: isoprenyl transferase [Clostridia bacterium]|nr:isoprenyl transferase [Clostridia bacterium]MBQ2670817.1 isoprenyl transferase [Clostridia bacterium]MBQ3462220.1 isoprenyl transferase [Clostridia bacterium]MBQ9598714.1 isoprenyl transferase [Clostridia bacterium]MBR0090034.1 isoprenyl transferase [Clostridia bacterium]
MALFKKKQAEIDPERLPKHIGVIMDGNGRWAKKRGLPRSAGHSAGADALKKIVTEANNLGVKYITVYAFSTENWKRPEAEVNYLMSLLLDYLKNAEKTLSGENVVIRCIGSRKELSDEIQEQIKKTEKFTSKNDGIVMNIALNYGGREEITNAVKVLAGKVKDGEISAGEITEADIENNLYTSSQPDVDLLIRTSGEQRLSNFMLWQVSYAEMWFTDKLWPDFKPADLRQAIIDFQSRGRRFGGV